MSNRGNIPYLTGNYGDPPTTRIVDYGRVLSQLLYQLRFDLILFILLCLLLIITDIPDGWLLNNKAVSGLGIALAILTESAVSFLGLGFPLELPTWGKLLDDAKDRISLNVWLVAGPGLLLSATVMSVNLIGDGLRDALDPQNRSNS